MQACGGCQNCIPSAGSAGRAHTQTNSALASGSNGWHVSAHYYVSSDHHPKTTFFLNTVGLATKGWLGPSKDTVTCAHLDSSFQGDLPQQCYLLQAVGLHSLVHRITEGGAGTLNSPAPISAPLVSYADSSHPCFPTPVAIHSHSHCHLLPPLPGDHGPGCCLRAQH